MFFEKNKPNDKNIKTVRQRARRQRTARVGGGKNTSVDSQVIGGRISNSSSRFKIVSKAKTAKTLDINGGIEINKFTVSRCSSEKGRRVRTSKKTVKNTTSETAVQVGVSNRKAVTTVTKHKSVVRKRKQRMMVIIFLFTSGILASFLFGIYDDGQIDVAEVIANHNNRLLAEGASNNLVPTKGNPQKPDGGLVGLGTGGKSGKESGTASSTATTPATTISGEVFTEKASSTESVYNTALATSSDIGVKKDADNILVDTLVGVDGSISAENATTSSAKATSSVSVKNDSPTETSVVIE